MTMRLIDADELGKKAFNAYGIYESVKDSYFVVSIRDIINAPTIDAVSVMRCKDCKWFYESDTVICCEKHTGLALARKDDYCSYGERKEKTDETD